MSFATDTAATQIGPGHFTAELDERWSSLVGIHGGYTAAIVANAITAAVDDPSRGTAQLRHPVRLHSTPGTGRHRGGRRKDRQVDDHHERTPAAGREAAAGRGRGELDEPPGARLRRPRPTRLRGTREHATVLVLRRRGALPERRRPARPSSGPLRRRAGRGRRCVAAPARR
ncbi:MAG: hypothetical protein V9E94_21165 [Microthrixaceae bacterium]